MAEIPPVVFPATEGVLLIRNEHGTMAVHLVSVTVVMEPIVNDPGIPNERVYFYRGPTIEGYNVEAHGMADTLTVWTGPDPFAKPELDKPRAALGEWKS